MNFIKKYSSETYRLMSISLSTYGYDILFRSPIFACDLADFIRQWLLRHDQASGGLLNQYNQEARPENVEATAIQTRHWVAHAFEGGILWKQSILELGRDHWIRVKPSEDLGLLKSSEDPVLGIVADNQIFSFACRDADSMACTNN